MRLEVTVSLVLTMAVLLAGCGGGDPRGATELQARAQTVVQGAQTQLQGQFQVESDGPRLRGELDTANLPPGTPISFCLVMGSASTPISAPQITTGNGQELAQFQLDSQSEQPVPNVIAGDKFEARQGANSTGAPDCSAPLSLSAIFQPRASTDEYSTGSGQFRRT